VGSVYQRRTSSSWVKFDGDIHTHSITDVNSGGSFDSQKEFLEALSLDSSVKRAQDRHGSKQPQIANNFALGYTYYDVMDADHEGLYPKSPN
jgi:hypothetical protein